MHKKFIRYAMQTLLPLCFLSPTAFADNETVNFLAISDIHFDPFQYCGDSTPCKLIDTLSNVPASRWNEILAQDVRPYAPGHDSSYQFLEFALDGIKKRAEATNNLRFALVTGDFLGHHYQDLYYQYASDKTTAGYQSFVNKTFKFLTSQLEHTLPNVDVYSVMGNNDSYSGDYNMDDLPLFSQDLAANWSSLIRTKKNQAAFQSQFKHAGYYAVKAPGTENLLLVGLNSTVFSKSAEGGNYQETAKEELQFLHNTLASAQRNHERVLIFMHIPDIVDAANSSKSDPYQTQKYWRSEYSESFQQELYDHRNMIAGIIAGHLHLDWFHVVNNIPVASTTSISPLFNNSGFKVFNYSTATDQLVNYQTYYQSPETNNEWRLEYDFNQTYQPGCVSCKLVNGMNSLDRDNPLIDAYTKYYQVSADSPINLGNWIYYWCSIHHNSVGDYEACLDTPDLRL